MIISSEKKCSASWFCREIKIKTTIRYHFISTKRTQIKKVENSKCWGECEEIGTHTLQFYS